MQLLGICDWMNLRFLGARAHNIMFHNWLFKYNFWSFYFLNSFSFIYRYVRGLFCYNPTECKQIMVYLYFIFQIDNIVNCCLISVLFVPFIYDFAFTLLAFIYIYCLQLLIAFLFNGLLLGLFSNVDNEYFCFSILYTLKFVLVIRVENCNA